MFEGTFSDVPVRMILQSIAILKREVNFDKIKLN